MERTAGQREAGGASEASVVTKNIAETAGTNGGRGTRGAAELRRRLLRHDSWLALAGRERIDECNNSIPLLEGKPGSEQGGEQKEEGRGIGREMTTRETARRRDGSGTRGNRRATTGAHLLSEGRLGLLSLQDGLKASTLFRIQGSHVWRVWEWSIPSFLGSRLTAVPRVATRGEKPAVLSPA